MPSAIETPVPEESDSRPLKLRILRAAPVVVILGLLVHLLLPRLDTIADSLETLRSLRPWAIADRASDGEPQLRCQWRAAPIHRPAQRRPDPAAPSGRDRDGRRTVALVAAGPLGFGAAIYKWTREGGVSTDTAALASWLPSIFDAASLVFFALLGGVELLHFHRLSGVTVTALVIVVSVLTVAIAVADHPAGAQRLDDGDGEACGQGSSNASGRDGMTPRLMRGVQRRAETWQRMRNGCMAPAGLLFAAGPHLRPALPEVRVPRRRTGPELSLLLAGYGVPLLLGRASFIPGGVAVTEVAMAALFGGLEFRRTSPSSPCSPTGCSRSGCRR